MREGFEYFEETKQMLYNGVVLPSVGSIIAPVSATYYTEDIPEEYLEIAKYRGKVIHEAVEKFLTLGIVEIEDEKYRGYLDAFLAWFYKMNPEVLGVEEVIYTNKFWGIQDIRVKIKDKVYVVDIKNSSKIIRELIELQLTGYKKGNEAEEREIDGLLGLHLKKDGKYEVHFLTPREEQFDELVEDYYKED